jgi:hypothetical protein
VTRGALSGILVGMGVAVPEASPAGPDADPFGRGWATAGITLGCMLVLVLARSYGAGAYGIGAVPFLLGFFVATGVVAGRAVGALVGRVWSVAAWLFGVPVGVAAFVGSGAVWNSTPSESALLVRLFAITAVAAVLWAFGSSEKARLGARVTAAGSALFLVVAIAANL